jgi:hypothetical protein
MSVNSGRLVHSQVVGFGDKWLRFNQSSLAADERQRVFEDCFAVCPSKRAGPTSVAVDVGCAAPPLSGEIARRNLAAEQNIEFFRRSALAMMFRALSLGFAYLLGVLHHVPDTKAALGSSGRELTPGVPILLVSTVHLTIGSIGSSLTRMCDLICRSIAPPRKHPRYIALQLNAALVLGRLARLARVLEIAQLLPTSLPLSVYRSLSFYIRSTSSRDRFATRLKQRVIRAKITAMLESQGLSGLHLFERTPFWRCVGTRS